MDNKKVDTSSVNSMETKPPLDLSQATCILGQKPKPITRLQKVGLQLKSLRIKFMSIYS